MSAHITIWEPGRHWRNAVTVPPAILLSPLLLAGMLISFLVVGSLSPFRKLFPPRPLTAKELLADVDVLLGKGEDDAGFEDAFDELRGGESDRPEVEALRQRVKFLGDPPWNDTQIDELKAVRESARALIGGQT